MEVICMRKRGPQTNPLIIELDRSLMARGSQEAVDISPPSSPHLHPHPHLYAVIKYPIYGIELQCSFTLQRAAVIGV